METPSNAGSGIGKFSASPGLNIPDLQKVAILRFPDAGVAFLKKRLFGDWVF
jgi:hypothetical protein